MKSRSVPVLAPLLALGLGIAPCDARTAAAPAVVEVRVDSCTLVAPDSWARALETLAERVREIVPRLEQDLGCGPAGPFRMVLVPGGRLRDPDLIRLDQAAPPWAAGYMIPARRIGAIRLAAVSRYPYGSLESVFAHEATHLVLHDAIPGSLPRWLDEGIATWEGRRWSFEDDWLYSAAVLGDRVPPLSRLEPAFDASAASARQAYAASFSFVSWALDSYGHGMLSELIRECRRRPLDRAWREVTGVPLVESERAWRRDSLSRVRWLLFAIASNLLWIGITLLALVAGVVRRVRASRVRDAMPDEPWPEFPAEMPGEPEGLGPAAEPRPDDRL